MALTLPTCSNDPFTQVPDQANIHCICGDMLLTLTSFCACVAPLDSHHVSLTPLLYSRLAWTLLLKAGATSSISFSSPRSRLILVPTPANISRSAHDSSCPMQRSSFVEFIRLPLASFWSTTLQPRIAMSGTKKTCTWPLSVWEVHIIWMHISKEMGRKKIQKKRCATYDAREGSMYGFWLHRGMAAMLASQNPWVSWRNRGCSSVSFVSHETTIRTTLLLE